jgi:hypothetical protein
MQRVEIVDGVYQVRDDEPTPRTGTALHRTPWISPKFAAVAPPSMEPNRGKGGVGPRQPHRLWSERRYWASERGSLT